MLLNHLLPFVIGYITVTVSYIIDGECDAIVDITINDL